MPLGTEVGLGPGDIVLDGEPPPSPKEAYSPSITVPCLLCPNGWMDQDALGMVMVGPTYPQKKGTPTLDPSIVAKWLDG